MMSEGEAGGAAPSSMAAQKTRAGAATVTCATAESGPRNPVDEMVRGTEGKSFKNRSPPGLRVGTLEGREVGSREGAREGMEVGWRVGRMLGSLVGLREGASDGSLDGRVVGVRVGWRVGRMLGSLVGLREGASDGSLDGRVVGVRVGRPVGRWRGTGQGEEGQILHSQRVLASTLA
jgi:hypothetical protein